MANLRFTIRTSAYSVSSNPAGPRGRVDFLTVYNPVDDCGSEASEAEDTIDLRMSACSFSLVSMLITIYVPFIRRIAVIERDKHTLVSISMVYETSPGTAAAGTSA